MSVLIEALCLVVPRSVVDASYPGGTDACRRDALAADIEFRYCIADDRLTVMSFFDSDAAKSWMARLASHGMVHVHRNESVEMVLVDQRFGPTMPCSWLEWRRHEDGFTYAWLAGTEPGDMVAPVGWMPEQSRQLVRTDIRDEPGRMLRLAEEDGVETWIDFRTGDLVSGLAHREEAVVERTASTTITDGLASMAASDLPLLPIVTAALHERNLRYMALSEQTMALPIRTDLATYDCILRVDDELRTVTCYLTHAVRVPERRRLAIAEAITRANYGLLLGCFELDMNDGEIRFRTSVDVEGGALTTAMCHSLMAAAVSVSDRYHEALMRVACGGAEPAAAIAEAEAE